MRFLTVEKNAFFVKFSFLVKINGQLAFANCPFLSVFTSFLAYFVALGCLMFACATLHFERGFLPFRLPY